jgi:lamin tail-like protein
LGVPAVRRSLLSRPIALAIAFSFSAFAIAATPAASPQAASAASCVRFSASHFNAPGDDNQAVNLNGEWVRIRNYCSTTKSLSHWTIKDYGSKHTYTFPTGVSIRPGYSITLYSGRGTNTSTKRYWGRTYGAVWNNSAPEYAYLRNSANTLQSRWTEY